MNSVAEHEASLTSLVDAKLQRRLARFNAKRIAPAKPTAEWRKDLHAELALRLEEGSFLENLRREVEPQAAVAPRDAAGFIRWFESLNDDGPGQHDPLFDWLATQATLPQMRWFLLQEAAGEAGFDDLVALTQLRMPVRPKLELARNYWDEMGRGRQQSMHGPMLADLIADLDLLPDIDSTVVEALALANTMLGLALNRRYAYHAIGALGAVELTAPDRVGKVAAGLKRLGCSTRQRIYFDLHSAIDLRHSLDWNAEIIAPLVSQDVGCARFIAEGALMRLHCGARCFERYRRELWELNATVTG